MKQLPHTSLIPTLCSISLLFINSLQQGYCRVLYTARQINVATYLASYSVQNRRIVYEQWCTTVDQIPKKKKKNRQARTRVPNR